MKKTNSKSKHELGQYFTTNKTLQEKIYKFILNKPSTILEPSIGQGHLVSHILEKNPEITFDMYEIDTTIPVLDSLKMQEKNIIYGDFMQQSISKKYTTIIGNPPFVRTKKGNLYIDFTKKCFELLDDENGELIFIVPSDFFKLTCASELLNTMMHCGTFTHIFHPHNENLFENAYIDVLVFRYCKNNINNNPDNQVMYNDRTMYIINNNGMITFSEEEPRVSETVLFKDYFDIYVGLVSGKEEVYKNETYGNIEVLNGEGKLEKYIYIEKYPCENEKINQYLLQHKPLLMNREIRKFGEHNWHEWGAPRNINSIRQTIGKECIYIYNLTRKPKIAFLDKVQYFGGGLIMLVPKKKCNLNRVLDFMNSDGFKSNFMFSGRFKIGHRSISNSCIPLSELNG